MKTMALVLPLALTACAPQLEGNWADQQGTPAFRLAHGQYFLANPDGSDAKSPRAGLPPLPQPYPYKVAGRVVLVEQGRARAQFEILPDGRLKLSQGGHALFFVRK
ncbi:MAG TPA: hypothetical protein VFS95_06025 [Telluria sp.]|jgi:hypothetical protein|nr:hypothetical protein [Telluria sp.]